MAQPSCDVVKIAEAHVRAQFPFVVIENRRPSKLLDGDVWKVQFLIPEDALGFVPEVRIDRRTCQIVGAILWQ